jgi:hypothetical protein
MNELLFTLHVTDDWPPVAIEAISCTTQDDGYKINAAPLFVKDLSVGDIINTTLNADGHVLKWKHKQQSDNSTIWLLRLARNNNIDMVLEELRALDCNTTELIQFGVYSVDIPASSNISAVDQCLSLLDESKVAIAYPSFRHPESE